MGNHLASEFKKKKIWVILDQKMDQKGSNILCLKMPKYIRIGKQQKSYIIWFKKLYLPRGPSFAEHLLDIGPPRLSAMVLQIQSRWSVSWLGGYLHTWKMALTIFSLFCIKCIKKLIERARFSKKNLVWLIFSKNWLIQH